jgi:hypothetical protein
MARPIATNTDVDRDALLDFLRSRHHVVLITTRHDGRLQTSPVSAGIDGQGRLVMSTYPQRAKVANLLRMMIERWGPIATGGFPPDLAVD